MSATAIETDRAATLESLNVSRETESKLDLYVELIIRWQRMINLVSATTLAHIWSRHILDSAQLLQFAPGGQTRWVDMGSGGGLPGLVVAALAQDRIGFEMILIESDQRKSAFLRSAAREMGLSGRVVIRAERVEVVMPTIDRADVVSARALAPLMDLVRLSEPLLSKGALGVYPKGENVQRELTAWGPPDIFKVSLAPSRTHPSAAIALVRMQA